MANKTGKHRLGYEREEKLRLGRRQDGRLLEKCQRSGPFEIAVIFGRGERQSCVFCPTVEQPRLEDCGHQIFASPMARSRLSLAPLKARWTSNACWRQVAAASSVCRRMSSERRPSRSFGST